jgi:hypothetical protein
MKLSNSGLKNTRRKNVVPKMKPTLPEKISLTITPINKPSARLTMSGLKLTFFPNFNIINIPFKIH